MGKHQKVDIKPEEHFRLKDGRVLKDLHELVDALKDMDKNTFEHHVNELKNDFGSWIKHVFKYDDIADLVFKLKDKEGMLKALESKLLELEKDAGSEVAEKIREEIKEVRKIKQDLIKKVANPAKKTLNVPEKKFQETPRQNVVKTSMGHIPVEKIEPLEGVVDFLTYLQNHKEYVGTITGNLKEPAKLILEKSDLRRFFSILSYDDGTKTREQILQHAIDEAKRQKYKFGRVVIVGDTTKDIEAGKYVNAFTVAVATGSDSLLTLKEKNPDIVLQTLRKYQHILEAIK